MHFSLDHLTPESTLADLPSYDFEVEASVLGHVVDAHFEQHVDLPGVIVRDAADLVGVIPRQAFFQQMSRLFSREIYLRRPIRLFFHNERPAPCCFPASCPINDAARTALSRPREVAYDPFVMLFLDGSLRLIDIHDVLLAQAQLLLMANQTIQKQKATAEAANRAKSTFLANMSHEIRTPMNGVLGMIDLALETEVTHEQLDYLSVAKSSADSLLTIINDILDYSKIEAGKLDIDPIEFRLRDTLADLLKTLALRAHQKGLELILGVRPDVPDVLIGDVGRLRQITINLVNNALKFTAQGEIVVEVMPTRDAEDSGRADIGLHFAVRDTGVGIPAEKLRLIFEPFAQADNSTTRRYGGTGLGLTICARLVDMMRGRIWVESEAGRGSTFHFTVQLGLGAAATPLIEPEQLQGLRVLVVDDNATHRRVLEEMLGNWRMVPTLADSGAAALQELQRAANERQPFAVIVLDALMPGMDGFDLAERIRGEMSRSIIMMLSSSDPHGDAARCRELGIVRSVAKPLKQSDLLDAIVGAVAGPPAPVRRRAAAGNATPLPDVRPLRILLAEDNPTNQMLVLTILRKQGHAITLARTGKEVLEHLQIGGANGSMPSTPAPFDLVLMDVQMPDMDGLEATTVIRAHERGTGRHLPILALTAHAMKGDREECLATGMDAYLTKPIQPAELRRAIASVAGPIDVVATSPEPVVVAVRKEEAPGFTAVDPAAAESVTGGDQELLRGLAESVRNECPLLLGSIRQSIAACDGKALHMAAHTLKSALRMFGAEAAWGEAQRLETMGREKSFGEADSACAALECAVERVVHELGMLLRVEVGTEVSPKIHERSSGGAR